MFYSMGRFNNVKNTTDVCNWIKRTQANCSNVTVYFKAMIIDFALMSIHLIHMFL